LSTVFVDLWLAVGGQEGEREELAHPAALGRALRARFMVPPIDGG
jgi:hypothetical protein